MRRVKRTAVIIIPKQPHIDWANSLEEDGLKLGESQDRTILTLAKASLCMLIFSGSLIIHHLSLLNWRKPYHVFLVFMELKTRKIVHTAVTLNPTDEWTAQHLKEATHGTENTISSAKSQCYLRAIYG